MNRQAARVLIVVVGVLLIAVYLLMSRIGDSGIGLEGGSDRPQLVWTIVNNSDEPIYTVLQQPDRETGVVEPGDLDVPAGNFSWVIPPGEKGGVQGAPATSDHTGPGGCFGSQDQWVVRSRSGGNDDFRLRTPVDDYINDLEVLWYIEGGTCTDQDELVLEYDGTLPTTTNA